MKEKILKNLDDPGQLEKLYRDNKTVFKREFNLIYPDIKEKATARVWNERLNFESEEISWGTKGEIIFVVVAGFIAGLIAKIPEIADINPEYFYQRNLSFIVFPLLTAYFAWKHKLQTKNLIILSAIFLVSCIYINVLPDVTQSDTLVLACIHLPLFLWTILGFVFVGGKLNNNRGRLDFLRYNGDLVVMTTIILIAGVLLVGVTFGLFTLIDIKIEKFYSQYVAIWGLAASPIVGTYLVQTNPKLVNNVSPVIAKIFTPLVFVTLVIYLIAVIYTGKDPYNDREFLIIFNLLLVGVMAIIFFSIAESSKHSDNKIGAILLMGLSIVTIIINGIALSAILFRISEWGITPNRLVVLGGNLLILINLLMVSFRLFRSVSKKEEKYNIENAISTFLPIYSLWSIIVTFIFPFIFQFK